MTVLEILEKASLYLNLYDDFLPFFDAECEQIASSEVQSEFDKMLKALNLVVSEIATDYIPIIYSQEVEVQDNKIMINSLTKDLNQIYSIKMVNSNRELKYKLFEDYIEVNALGKVNIIYGFYPQALTIEDNFNLFCGKVNQKTLAMGVASEYCFINGFFDDATIWDERFKQGLNVSLRKRSLINTPQRRWF